MIRAVCAFAIIAGLLFTLGQLPNDHTDPYCEMTSIYEKTNGEYGWPKHNPDKDASCTANTANQID